MRPVHEPLLAEVRAGAVVLAAHGTRSAEGRDRVRALRDHLTRLLPGHTVLLGHVDVEQPTLEQAVAQASCPPVLVPLFLTAGHHVRTDVAVAAATRPGTTVLPWLGAHAVVHDLLLEALTTAPGPGAVILVSAGSSDPRARAEVATLAHNLTATSGRPVRHGFLAGPGPRAADILSGSTLALAHLLAPGHFATRLDALAQPHGIPVSSPLLTRPGGVDAIAGAIAARVTRVTRVTRVALTAGPRSRAVRATLGA